MDKIILIVLLILSTSCAIRPEVSRRDRLIVSITEQEWLQEKELPNPGNCLKNLNIVTLSKENFRNRCGTSSFLSDGCVDNKRLGTLIPSKTIYLSPRSYEKERDIALIKMTLHALAECTADNGADRYDSAEFRKYIWFRTADIASVEYRALRRIR